MHPDLTNKMREIKQDCTLKNSFLVTVYNLFNAESYNGFIMIKEIKQIF